MRKIPTTSIFIYYTNLDTHSSKILASNLIYQHFRQGFDLLNSPSNEWQNFSCHHFSVENNNFYTSFSLMEMFLKVVVTISEHYSQIFNSQTFCSNAFPCFNWLFKALKYNQSLLLKREQSCHLKYKYLPQPV